MYGKLFASLYQGTLRGRSDEILVFTNLVAHADSRGFVDKHWLAIAQETGLSIEQVKAAIDVLEAPDPDSRSPEENGRRLVRMDEHRAWGWRIVNHAKYRAIRSEEDRREQNRLAQERFRDKSNKSKPRKPRSAQAEAEAEAEAKDKTNVGLSPDADPASKKKAELRKTACEVIAFLNAKAGRNFDANGANADHVVARLRDGETVEDLRAVIAMKVRDWKGDEKMAEYLRPETLFNRTKFASYKGKLSNG